MDRVPLWLQFENLAKQLLEEKSFSIEENPICGDMGFDFLGNFGGDRWAIEVKFYRTARVRPALIEAAATRVVNNAQKNGCVKGMLIISSTLTPELKSVLEASYGIDFVDRLELQKWAAQSPQLYERLHTILEIDPDLNQESMSEIENQDKVERKIDFKSIPQIETRGTDLFNELVSIKPGKKTWEAYEKICIKILEYLFSNQLEGWHAQKSTDDELNRYDFVCRIKPVTEFWKLLIGHLNTRYIVFEFKNYSSPIKQSQILTTEKYLLEKAFRSVAIIFTRQGADRNAVKMTQGAMREHGKLIIVLNDDSVEQMLKRKEEGLDPTDCLFDITDDFLMTLPR